MTSQISRRTFLGSTVGTAYAALAGLQGEDARAGSRSGPFQPTWESLHQYACPEWFRDAKFGIWAHWTAQCVPEQGDWYARRMYIEGDADYKFQCAHYGHPSKVGFKDIDRIWRAENWNPERMIQLYKAAGAKYFVALANHHDNFDCFDSKYQPWNAVRLGPKKDLVGIWAQTARRHGLRFGVTCHAARTWNWFEVAQGADKYGPLAGVPYDGKLTKADGAGTWWEGLDPQDLYAQNHAPGKKPDSAYCEKFFNRTIDLIDKYRPDLLYFDDSVLPFYGLNDVGLRIAAYHYNARLRGGKTEAVLNGKDLFPDQARCMVHDFERGRSGRIEPYAWQTDTCIGDWHYRRALYETHRYKTTRQVVRMLADIVAKNGCLLLNIPVRGDGSLDEDEIKFLEGMAAWMRVNGESIFGTRPWTLSGEGPVKIRGGGFSEGGEDRLTAEDFRFTTKGATLYATAMGWPTNGTLVVRTLAANAPGVVGKIKRVQLLGHGDVPFQTSPEGLTVTLPRQAPCEHAWVLKISGLDVATSHPSPPTAPPLHASADGSISLPASEATLDGTLRVQSGSEENIGYWDSPNDTASWRARFDTPGKYALTARIATAEGATTFAVALDGVQQTTCAAPQTGGWDNFQTVEAGFVTVAAAGDHTLTIRPADRTTWRPMNLASVTLRKAP